MREILFPCGKEKLAYSFEEAELAGVLTTALEHYVPAGSFLARKRSKLPPSPTVFPLL